VQKKILIPLSLLVIVMSGASLLLYLKLDKRNHLQQNKIDFGSILTISKDGTLIYKHGGSLWIKNKKRLKSIQLGKEVINVSSQNDVFLSDDGRIIYLVARSYPNEQKSNVRERKVLAFNLNDLSSCDLLDKLNIDYNGFLYWAAYQKNKLLLLVEDAQQEQSLIIIDLTKNTHQVIDLAVQNVNAVDFLGPLFICSYYNEQLKRNQLAVLDSNGKVTRYFDIKNNNVSVVFRASEDGKYLLFSQGKTPQGLFLYNINDGCEYVVIPPVVNETYRHIRYAGWKDDESFYILELIVKPGSEDEYALREEKVSQYVK